MANMLFSTLVAVVVVIISLCVSNCLSSVVGNSGGNSIARTRNDVRLANSKANSIQRGCFTDSECDTYAHNFGYCWHATCYYCSGDKYFDLIDGECKDIDDDVDDSVKIAVGLGLGLGIGIPLAIIASIVACCFCCAGCAGHRYRQRRNQRKQPTQITLNPDAAYDQHGNPIQYQYVNVVPLPKNGHNRNEPVKVLNGSAHFPVQQQNVYQNVDTKTHP